MKQIKQLFIHFLAIILTVIGFSPSVLAADATLSFASSVTSTQVGSEIKITVNASIPGFNAASTTFKVKYDPNLLEYQSYNGSGSGFPSELSEPNVSNGLITHSRGKTGSGVTGNVKVVEYNFKAKANGSTTVRFDPSQMWEAGTGVEKSLDTGSTVNLSFSSSGSSQSSTSTAQPTATPKPATPKPSVTAKPATPKPTATPTSTPTTAATVAPTATPSPSTTGASPTSSTVTLSETTAVADGVDSITVNVIVRDANGTILADQTPSFFGLREGDVGSDFTFDAITLSWTATLTSTTPGTLFMTVSAASVDLANQDVTFTESTVTPATADTSGSSFTTIILVGLLVLLLLLFILFFVWRRLKSHDDNDELPPNDSAGAFPGDESQAVDTVIAPQTAAIEQPEVESSPRLNQDAILSRSTPPEEQQNNPPPQV